MNQMCRKNMFVLWEHCGHQERSTSDPCGHAPGGIYGGIWSVSCAGVFHNQVLETVRLDGICRACGDATTKSSRHEADESLRQGQVHLARITRMQREIEELTARTFARLAEEREKGGRA
jgi:hypothetical protein